MGRASLRAMERNEPWDDFDYTSTDARRAALRRRIIEVDRARYESRANTRYYLGQVLHQLHLLFRENLWLRLLAYTWLTCLVLLLIGKLLRWD